MSLTLSNLPESTVFAEGAIVSFFAHQDARVLRVVQVYAGRRPSSKHAFTIKLCGKLITESERRIGADQVRAVETASLSSNQRLRAGDFCSGRMILTLQTTSPHSSQPLDALGDVVSH